MDQFDLPDDRKPRFIGGPFRMTAVDDRPGVEFRDKPSFPTRQIYSLRDYPTLYVRPEITYLIYNLYACVDSSKNVCINPKRN